MSLLRDIQDAAIDSSVEVSVLLRKCKVLAARLGNEEFKRWVDSELDGYKIIEQLPEYRILSVTSKGHFSGGFGSGIRNADIPMSSIQEDYREPLSHSYAMQPIASLQSLVNSADGSYLQDPWAPDVVAIVGKYIYRDMNCLQAWKVIPHAAIVGIIDTVRNRVLSFVLEIEEEAPDAGEAPLNTNPIPQERVSQVFNTFISGNVSNMSAGSSGVIQSDKFVVVQYDTESLLSYLSGKGVSDLDLDALRTAISEDARDEKEGATIGSNVMGWMGKMFTKSAEGTLKIGSDVFTKILTNAIHEYYGL